VAQTTANEQEPSENQSADAPDANQAKQGAVQLSDTQLQALAKKVYQLLCAEVRLTLERQGR
jgi:hypothetical protein